MNDISGVGLQVRLIASNTFPGGILLTAFADDADPLDFASIQIADKAMGLNGNLIVWARAIALPMTLNLIPGSDDDLNMQVIAEANRVARGKRSVRDVISATVMYGDGSTETRSPGKMTDTMFGNSVASAGRMKTKPYIFAFENRVSAIGS